MTDAYLQTEVRLSVRTQWYMGDQWSGKYIFHPVPLCLCSSYTHYTTGNTCNASRRDFWQRGRGNNFRKPAPILFSFSLHPPLSYVSHRSGGWRQLISSPWHAMMERRALNPSTYSRPCAPARLRPERQCVGRLASLLICHGWTGSETLTLLRAAAFLHFCGTRHTASLSVTISHTLTLTVGIYFVLKHGACCKCYSIFHCTLTLIKCTFCFSQLCFIRFNSMYVVLFFGLIEIKYLTELFHRATLWLFFGSHSLTMILVISKND